MILIAVILPRNFRGEPTANTLRRPRRANSTSASLATISSIPGGAWGGGLKQAGRQARLQSRELCDHNRHCPCWPHPLRLAVAARRRKQRVEVGSRRRSCWQLTKNNQRCTVWVPGGLGGGREPFVEPPRTGGGLPRFSAAPHREWERLHPHLPHITALLSQLPSDLFSFFCKSGQSAECQPESASAGGVNVSLREQERPPGRLPGELETMETRAATIAHKNTHTHTPGREHSPRRRTRRRTWRNGEEEEECDGRKGGSVHQDGHMMRSQERASVIFRARY